MPGRLRYSQRQVSAVPHKNGSLEAALAQLRRGGMVVVCDDPDRENEGDLCMAAQFVTAEKIAFMACEARGLICLSLPSQRCDELELPLMVPANDGSEATARTIQVAIDPDNGPDDLVRPGHIFPLRARPNGVLERRGQTEAAIDLTRLAGLTPGGVLCELMNADGTMARGVQLQALCSRHDLPMVTVEEIAAHLNATAPAITAV
jgi:3,4-dihydroxy 2-butanone 4-phosphate synthase/GTP cyclohydrolase II